MSEAQLLHQNHGQGGPEPQVIRQRVQLARALDPNRRKLIEYKEWVSIFQSIERRQTPNYYSIEDLIEQSKEGTWMTIFKQ